MLSDSLNDSNHEPQNSVLVSTSYYVPAFLGGGPIRTLKVLISSAPSNFNSHVICLNQDLGESAPLVDHPNQWLERGDSKVRYVQGGLFSLLQAFYSAREVDILYLNSLFNPKFSFLPLLLRRLGRWKNSIVLMAPRGELHPGALAQKARKKKLFLWSFRLVRVSTLIHWHASSEEEAAQIRAVFGPKARIMIREDETSLPAKAYQRPARLDGPLRLLFVSRLHPQKGLHVVLEALEEITKPVRVEVIGSFVNDKYEAICRAIAARLPSHVELTFHGPLPHEDVLHQMRQADFLTLPTAGENFGHVIAEALSGSCPVLCSDNTPWSDLLAQGGGAVISPNTPVNWAEIFINLLERSSSDWQHKAQLAGESYDQWSNELKGQHIFSQALTY